MGIIMADVLVGLVCDGHGQQQGEQQGQQQRQTPVPERHRDRANRGGKRGGKEGEGMAGTAWGRVVYTF